MSRTRGWSRTRLASRKSARDRSEGSRIPANAAGSRRSPEPLGVEAAAGRAGLHPIAVHPAVRTTAPIVLRNSTILSLLGSTETVARLSVTVRIGDRTQCKRRGGNHAQVVIDSDVGGQRKRTGTQSTVYRGETGRGSDHRKIHPDCYFRVRSGAQGAVIGVDPNTKGPTGYAKFPPKYRIAPHWHSYAEYVTVISGKATLTLDGKPYQLAPGSYAVIPAKTTHDLTCGASECLVISRRAGPTEPNRAK